MGVYVFIFFKFEDRDETHLERKKKKAESRFQGHQWNLRILIAAQWPVGKTITKLPWYECECFTNNETSW